MNKIVIGLAGLLFTVAVISSCQKLLPGGSESNEVLAGPLENLSSDQLSLHLHGDAEFARVFGEADGLGPIFVQNACESCHAGDGKGNPFNNLTRFGRYDQNGDWDAMLGLGGPQLQHRAVGNFTPEVIPDGSVSTQFIAPNVTGLGYLAAVTDADILAMADPNDNDGDGISGTVNYIAKPGFLQPDSRYQGLQPNGQYIGRFGRKAAAIDLLHQTVNAYKQDMGITSIYDQHDPVNFQTAAEAEDAVLDPEIPGLTVNRVVFYLKTLKAPERRGEEKPDVIAGENLFNTVGCESCHTATLHTGPSEIEDLNNVDFHPYTDMLMHDMGAGLDDQYTEGSAETFEWRTPPLWGLGLQSESQGGEAYYLHDGRARSIDAAVQLHGGESAASRTAYNVLTGEEKNQLITFLNSL